MRLAVSMTEILFMLKFELAIVYTVLRMESDSVRQSQLLICLQLSL